MVDPVTLSTAGLLLRPPVPADADVVLRACQDPEIVRWTSVPTPYTESDARTWVRLEAAAGWASDTHLVWYACDPIAPGVPLVSVGLHHLDLPAGAGEIGYWTVPDARGRGLTTAAVAAVCRYAFDELGLHRVEWTAGVGNDASRRVAEKTGFVVEATGRQRLARRGDREDAWVGGLLPGDLIAPERVEVGPAPAFASVAGDGHGGGSAAVAGRHPAVRGVEITAGSLHLRPWRDSDVDVVVALLADPLIGQWNPITRAGSAREDAQRFVDRAQDEDASHVSFAVADATTGDVLGHVAVHHLDLDAGHGELGYWTVPAARGRGVATRAVSALTRWAFGALGLTRLELFHATENTASCSLAERTGYLREGTLRQSYRYGDGVRHDEHMHGRLATEPEPA